MNLLTACEARSTVSCIIQAPTLLFIGARIRQRTKSPCERTWNEGRTGAELAIHADHRTAIGRLRHRSRTVRNNSPDWQASYDRIDQTSSVCLEYVNTSTMNMNGWRHRSLLQQYRVTTTTLKYCQHDLSFNKAPPFWSDFVVIWKEYLYLLSDELPCAMPSIQQ